MIALLAGKLIGKTILGKTITQGGAKAIVLVGALLALVLATVIFTRSCDSRADRAAQARLEREQSKAASDSARDAIGTVTRRQGQETASENLTRDNERDIRAAPGAGERVNSGVDVAGRRALCKRAAYRDDPKCAMFRKEGR